MKRYLIASVSVDDQVCVKRLSKQRTHLQCQSIVDLHVVNRMSERLRGNLNVVGRCGGLKPCVGRETINEEFAESSHPGRCCGCPPTSRLGVIDSCTKTRIRRVPGIALLCLLAAGGVKPCLELIFTSALRNFDALYHQRDVLRRDDVIVNISQSHTLADIVRPNHDDNVRACGRYCGVIAESYSVQICVWCAHGPNAFTQKRVVSRKVPETTTSHISVPEAIRLLSPDGAFRAVASF